MGISTGTLYLNIFAIRFAFLTNSHVITLSSNTLHFWLRNESSMDSGLNEVSFTFSCSIFTITEAMKESKTHEKLKEKAFESFMKEENAREYKEIDELVSYTYGQKRNSGE